jgi:hypothetical protein
VESTHVFVVVLRRLPEGHFVAGADRAEVVEPLITSLPVGKKGGHGTIGRGEIATCWRHVSREAGLDCDVIDSTEWRGGPSFLAALRKGHGGGRCLHLFFYLCTE